MPSLTLQKLQDLRALTTVSTPATVFALRMKRQAKPELRCSLESADEDTRYVNPEADLCSRARSPLAPACSSRLAAPVHVESQGFAHPNWRQRQRAVDERDDRRADLLREVTQ